jgi:methyl-accepting chemotaxis protein
MRYLKLIFYGALALYERHPIFCTTMLLLIILPPIFSEVARWIMLGILIFAILAIAIIAWQIRRLKRKFENEFRNATGGGFNNFSSSFGGGNTGFSGFSYTGGMTLEELVRKMQSEADQRQQSAQQHNNNSNNSDNDIPRRNIEDKGEYVDFEEIK